MMRRGKRIIFKPAEYNSLILPALFFFVKLGCGEAMPIFWRVMRACFRPLLILQTQKIIFEISILNANKIRLSNIKLGLSLLIM
jgi:hypothetical protein